MRTRSGLRVVVLAAILFGTGSGSQVEVHAAGRVVAGRPAADQCTEPADPIELTSVEQVRSLLVGTWTRCAGPALQGALVDDVGIEVAADGQFYRVYELPDGSLARATGPDQEGAWGVTDATAWNGVGSYQLDWTLSGGMSTGGMVTFFESPPTLRFDVGDYVAYFHRWTGDPPQQDQPPITVGDCPALGSETGDESVLVGTWIRCSGPSFAGDLVDDVGIEVTSDGHFYRVFELPDGSLARATGADQEGTWQFIGGQLNWSLLGSGTAMTHPKFYTEPTMMYLENFPIEAMYFVRWDGARPATDQPPADAGACGALADPIEQTSIAHVEELLTGVWVRCAGPVVFVTQGDAVGVEIAADGRWYMLYEADDGSLIRGEGVDHEGTWWVQGVPPHYEFDAAILGSGGEGAGMTFFASPVRSMRLSTMIGDADYRIWTGDPPVSGVPTGQASECGVFTDLITPTSAEQATEFLIGTWTLCNGISSMFGTLGLEGEVGLEMTADGHYYRLIQQADGSIVRATGTGMEGTWRAWINDYSDLQVDTQIAGLGTENSLTTIFGSPSGVRFRATGTSADYLRASIPTPPKTMPTTGVDVNVMLLGWAALLMVSGAAARASSHRNGLLRSAGSDTA